MNMVKMTLVKSCDGKLISFLFKQVKKEYNKQAKERLKSP